MIILCQDNLDCVNVKVNVKDLPEYTSYITCQKDLPSSFCFSDHIDSNYVCSGLDLRVCLWCLLSLFTGTQLFLLICHDNKLFSF